jgi:hypothetical protein
MTVRNLIATAALAAALAAPALVSATPIGVNYSDMWAKADEPGWGLTIDQQGDVLLGTLFIYDKGSLASWYTVQLAYASTSPSGSVSYTGTLYQTTGPALGQPYDPNLLKYRQVGTATIEFGDAAHGLLTYTIDGAGATKQVARLTFKDNSIMGSYIGATQDVTYDCKDAKRNGLVTTDPGPFTITQDADGLVMRFPTCTVTNGVFNQYGQITQVEAIYNCPGGVFGEMRFSALQSEQGGIVGTYTGKDASCSFRGNIGGMRFLKP